MITHQLDVVLSTSCRYGGQKMGAISLMLANRRSQLPLRIAKYRLMYAIASLKTN